jgi:hypothetical protein
MSTTPAVDYKEANKEHYKTPLAFAEWRVNELKKPVAGGIINETIDAIIELVNGILGQHIENDTQSWGHNFEQFEDMTLPRNKRIMSWVLRWPLNLASVLSLFPGLSGNVRRVIMPVIIYIAIILATVIEDYYYYNIYRILALLLLYIISYTELTYGRFCIIFLLGIAIEILVIAYQSGDEES